MNSKPWQRHSHPPHLLSRCPCATVSKADSDGSQIPSWSIGAAVWISIGGLCSIAGGVVVYRMVYSDGNGNLTGCSPVVQLVASPGAADYGALWIGTPGVDPISFVAATNVGIKVDLITGTWTFNAEGFFPG